MGASGSRGCGDLFGGGGDTEEKTNLLAAQQSVSSYEELKPRYKTLFYKYDADEDGQITRDEFREYYRDLYMAIGYVEDEATEICTSSYQGQEKAVSVFKLYDRDGDWKIAFKDFWDHPHTQSVMPLSEAQLASAVLFFNSWERRELPPIGAARAPRKKLDNRMSKKYPKTPRWVNGVPVYSDDEDSHLNGDDEKGANQRGRGRRGDHFSGASPSLSGSSSKVVIPKVAGHGIGSRNRVSSYDDRHNVEADRPVDWEHWSKGFKGASESLPHAGSSKVIQPEVMNARNIKPTANGYASRAARSSSQGPLPSQTNRSSRNLNGNSRSRSKGPPRRKPGPPMNSAKRQMKRSQTARRSQERLNAAARGNSRRGGRGGPPSTSQQDKDRGRSRSRPKERKLYTRRMPGMHSDAPAVSRKKLVQSGSSANLARIQSIPIGGLRYAPTEHMAVTPYGPDGETPFGDTPTGFSGPDNDDEELSSSEEDAHPAAVRGKNIKPSRSMSTDSLRSTGNLNGSRNKLNYNMFTPTGDSDEDRETIARLRVKEKLEKHRENITGDKLGDSHNLDENDYEDFESYDDAYGYGD